MIHHDTLILAIDPGRDKTGVAFISMVGDLISMSIEETQNLEEQLDRLKSELPMNMIVGAVVCGNGTYHQQILPSLTHLGTAWNIPVHVIDERNSTVEGRARYWQYHKRPWWKQWLPDSWCMPPVPVDDYTAWIIGERFIKTQKEDTKE